MEPDRRKERRDNCGVRVDVALHEEDCQGTDCGPWSSLTSDISYSGMSIYAEREFREGQRLKIFLRHISNEPVMAKVAWCKRVSGNLFRVGIRYC